MVLMIVNEPEGVNKFESTKEPAGEKLIVKYQAYQ